ncbi:hypothetical protein [Glycomyces arizonensis]|uniref:hypothetical protein n=1 Tax=Glycomyces arizonensis TaxID=256035 RepID=UPI0004143BAE|nr:hypothetical protein [Glycomyces arizonensis]
MRRTLKLLLVMGLAFVLQRPHGGGDGPDGPDDTTHNDADGDGNDSKKTTTPDGINASEDWGAAKDATKKKAEEGRANDSDGDGQPDVPSTTDDSTNAGSPALEPQYPDQWASPENLTSHYQDHRNDDNAEWESEAEYREAAIDLMSTDGGRREGVRIKTDGDTSYFYDPATGEFGRSGPRGIITYYIPIPDPEAHFNRQPGTEV